MNSGHAESREEKDDSYDIHRRQQLYAFADKRRNTTTGTSSPTTFLLDTTKIDPITYMLFGAHNLRVTERGLDCDEWLPIVGNVDVLDDIQRLKTLMDSSLLRIFEGIIAGRSRRARARDIRGARAEQPNAEGSSRALSEVELRELDQLTQAITSILDEYRDEYISKSRPFGTSRYSDPTTLAPRLGYNRQARSSSTMSQYISRGRSTSIPVTASA